MISPLFVTHNRSLIEIICVSEGPGTRRIILAEKRPCAPLGGIRWPVLMSKRDCTSRIFQTNYFRKDIEWCLPRKLLAQAGIKMLCILPQSRTTEFLCRVRDVSRSGWLLILSEETGGTLSFTVALTLFSVVYNRNSYRTVSSRANFVRNNSMLFMVLIRW